MQLSSPPRAWFLCLYHCCSYWQPATHPRSSSLPLCPRPPPAPQRLLARLSALLPLRLSRNPILVTPTDALAPPDPSHATCPPTRDVDIDPAAILELGPGPASPPTTAAGEKLVIIGTVYTEDCTPLAGAILNVWQTDANGEYGPGHGSDDMRCCYLMGSLRSRLYGHYQLITIKPAHYNGEQRPPPAHIHLEISHPQAVQLETEVAFAGDLYLPQTLQGYILVTLETAPASDGAADYLRGVADIIMS